MATAKITHWSDDSRGQKSMRSVHFPTPHMKRAVQFWGQATLLGDRIWLGYICFKVSNLTPKWRLPETPPKELLEVDTLSNGRCSVQDWSRHMSFILKGSRIWALQAHFTHETDSPWSSHFKYSHWWKRWRQSQFASHYAWRTNGACECKMDVRSTWTSIWHWIDHVSWSLGLFSKSTSWR